MVGIGMHISTRICIHRVTNELIFADVFQNFTDNVMFLCDNTCQHKQP